MMWKKLKAWWGCWRYGHDWWYHRDYNRNYRNLSIFWIKRTCWACGQTEIAFPRLGEEIYFDELGNPDRTKFFWVKEQHILKYDKEPRK